MALVPPTTSTPVKFQPPPFIQTTIKYQNVNNDINLQNSVTTKFHNKTIKWLKEDPSFKHSRKYLSKIEGPEGYKIIHKLLKLFVRKGETNWYDLGDQSILVKDFIKYKLDRYKE